MPSFRRSLSDEQIAALAQFRRALIRQSRSRRSSRTWWPRCATAGSPGRRRRARSGSRARPCRAGCRARCRLLPSPDVVVIGGRHECDLRRHAGLPVDLRRGAGRHELVRYLSRIISIRNSKDVVRISMATVATLSALVVGLLIASAKESFDDRATELKHAAAQSLLLDRTLAAYGKETDPARMQLHDIIQTRIEQLAVQGLAGPRSRQGCEGPVDRRGAASGAAAAAPERQSALAQDQGARHRRRHRRKRAGF